MSNYIRLGSYTTNDRTTPVIYSHKDLAALVEDNLTYYKEELDDQREAYVELEKKIERSEEEIRKDVEKQYEEQIDLYKKSLHLSFGSFKSEKEADEYQRFVEKHMQCRKNHPENTKLPYVMVSSPHGAMGEPVYIACCPICFELEDLTDLSTW